jgi:XTP/dITP diphosphohydrolase
MESSTVIYTSLPAKPYLLTFPDIMQTLIFATNNAHKVEEIKAVLPPDFTVISLKEAGISVDIPEPHDTLEANASEKSGFIAQLTGKDCFSEDTGLEVFALAGAPGVKSARYAGENATAGQNIDRLLQEMKDKTDRRARFRTIISLRWCGQEYLFEGICAGTIAPEPSGREGFGYDPVFIPYGSTTPFALMTVEEKNHFSHRAKAVGHLVEFLRKCSL